MNARIRRNLAAPAAAAVSTLIVLAWLAMPTAPASADSAQDASVSPAGNADPSPSPPRRLHSSLSMPYFSFAQPLTPRS
ncbi:MULTISPECIES: hypothetical protein [Stenotrophomonas]|jgi:hypothetical protein|uniref:hypothetical protein n=1 Tax=Stenotrophomonas TaxID=40323 RepID=UPI0006586346|nr:MULTISPECIES: hypothetical protein [Stenotrophomonas]KLN99574.1 hypothetical protein AA979_11265 [Stenotrophomonas maltophilia]MBH1512519.1 hypothetical protein [Stenotrophomonas maltophilia]MBH1546212.1 hypothetical protein [Stenotrophomonas maltophilia]MBH1860232.1 hypothetical protein [Stenotrophomonas maltophilia]MBN5063787.1 hypothetical protein [Stenotrophomonas maltophilia]